MARLTFYSFTKIRSYNATYMGVCGGRGLGKTFGGKDIVIDAALDADTVKIGGRLESQKQFILLRRYKEELTQAKVGFLADIAHKFPRHELRVNGSYFEFRESLDRAPDEDDKTFEQRNKKNEWIIGGHFVALSIAQHVKGRSFARVHWMIFDEFIIEKGNMQYLPSEVTAFNNFYNTVDRWEDRVKVFFFSNSVSIMNPYFLEWDIKPDQESEFVKRANGFIVFHFPDADKFQNEVFATRFGSFIKQTSPEYADYAVGNNFADNHEMLLGTKDYRATYLFTLETRKLTFSVWKSAPIGQATSELNYYVQRKRPKKELMFTMLADRMNDEKTLMTHSDVPLANLRSAFRHGRILFDTQTTRNAFVELVEKRG